MSLCFQAIFFTSLSDVLGFDQNSKNPATIVSSSSSAPPWFTSSWQAFSSLHRQQACCVLDTELSKWSLPLLLLWQQSPEPALLGEWSHWFFCVLPTRDSVEMLKSRLRRLWRLCFSSFVLGDDLVLFSLIKFYYLEFLWVPACVCSTRAACIRRPWRLWIAWDFFTLVLLWKSCFFSPLVSLGIAFNASELSQMYADLSYRWQFLSAWKILLFVLVSEVF